jgi:MurNAc alpha-1-phosphate uridylyltransferase
MIEAGKKPLIVHLIESLVREGIDEIIVNTAHLGEKIQAYLQDGTSMGAQIRYSPEYEALETGGGIYQALPLLGADPFLVINGDIATDYPFGKLKTLSVDLAHLVLVPNPEHHPKGDFGLTAGLAQNAGESRHTFGGIGLYRPELFSDCTAGRFPLAPLLRSAMTESRVSAELWEGFWMDIGTIERLEAFDQHLRQGQDEA